MVKKLIIKGCCWNPNLYEDWYPPCPYYREEEFVPDVCTHPDVRVPRFGTDYDYMVPRDIPWNQGIPAWCPLEDND